MLDTFCQELPQAELTVTTFAYGEVVEEAGLAYPYVADFRDYLKDFCQENEGASCSLCDGFSSTLSLKSGPI